jgi:hypothetical protein
MLQTGVERKATCRALFSKLLYLAESEELLPGADAEARRSLVADVFGATEDDAAQLRIVSLYEVSTSAPAMKPACRASLKGPCWCGLWDRPSAPQPAVLHVN